MSKSGSVFEASTIVAAAPEALFAFHAEPRNLTVVMPPTLRVMKLVTEGAAAEGGMIEFEGREWGVFPMRWRCRWKVVSPPHVLVDEMLEGPFRVFVHEHRFVALAGGRTRLEDRVTYAWGRGWWGRLVSEVVIRGYLRLLFAYRHWRTRRVFGGDRRPNLL